jgi:hypothetical protein
MRKSLILLGIGLSAAGALFIALGAMVGRGGPM